MSSDGKWIASIGRQTGGPTLIWRVSGEQNVLDLAGELQHESVIDAAFAAFKGLVATAGADGIVWIWQVVDRQRGLRLRHSNEIIAVRFSPDSESLLTASKDRTACLWDTQSGRKLATFAHAEMLCDIAFSPDGRLVATAGFDNARLWDRGGDEIASFEHEQPGVLAVAFSPDGRLLATGGCDDSARVWEVPSGREIARLYHQAYAGEVGNVSFSPSGEAIAVGGGWDGISVWEWPPR